MNCIQHIAEIMPLDSPKVKRDIARPELPILAAPRYPQGAQPMSPICNVIAAAAATGLTAIGAVQAAPEAPSLRATEPGEKAVPELVRRSLQANQALLRGDVATYRALIPITADFTLMSPFGATPTHGVDMTEERWQRMERFFKDGSLEQEVVQTYATADMVVLAVIERAHVAVGGLPAQAWALRVTLVYRREGGEWRLAHRHADPLAHGVTVEQAAALARGASGTD
jgi:ketosteroid isomerase-like protein